MPEPAADTQHVFIKWSQRTAIDFAEASVAIAVSSSAASIVLGNVAPVPWKATEAEAAVAGQTITEAVAEAAGEAAVDGAFALPANSYKIQLAKTLVKRALLA